MEKIQPKDWIPLIKPYTKPSVARSLRQVADTLLPLLALFYLAHKALSVSLLLALPVNLPFFSDRYSWGATGITNTCSRYSRARLERDVRYSITVHLTASLQSR